MFMMVEAYGPAAAAEKRGSRDDHFVLRGRRVLYGGGDIPVHQKTRVRSSCKREQEEIDLAFQSILSFGARSDVFLQGLQAYTHFLCQHFFLLLVGQLFACTVDPLSVSVGRRATNFGGGF
jgi:hypothetical protein